MVVVCVAGAAAAGVEISVGGTTSRGSGDDGGVGGGGRRRGAEKVASSAAARANAAVLGRGWEWFGDGVGCHRHCGRGLATIPQAGRRSVVGGD